MSGGLDNETLDMILDAIDEFAAQKLPDAVLLELDEKEMGSDLGVQLLFIAGGYGGLGGDAMDVYRVPIRPVSLEACPGLAGAEPVHSWLSAPGPIA
jgi:hypothetical protein